MTHRNERRLVPRLVAGPQVGTRPGRRITRATATIVVASAIIVATAGLVAAQDQGTPPPPPQPPPATSTSGTGGIGPDQTAPPPVTPQTVAPQKDDRLFFFMPNLLTVDNAANVAPLKTKQKFSLVAQGTFDPVEYPWYAFTSEISNANNADPTLGTGWSGYGKRYTLNFVDGTSENFLVGAVMPAAFHQDPRYYRMGKGGFLKRSGYAISRIVVTRSDSGHNQMNFSEIFGSGLAAGFGDLYHPRDERTLSNTLLDWKTLVAYDTLALFIREFWPDIRKAL